MKKKDRGIIEGRETPEDDVYIITGDTVIWADNAIDAETVEKELENNGNTEEQ